MMTWLIRALLALGVVVLGALALGNVQPERAAPASAIGADLPAVQTEEPTVQPTPRPTATREKFVERIISRVARETPAPYPTSTPLPAGVTRISMVDFGYMPSVARIHVGQTVIWRNDGRELHDVTGEDDWHSGPIEGTNEYRHTFGFEGSFNFRCSVHPDMRGTVIVQP
jgi:plastocyanin